VSFPGPGWRPGRQIGRERWQSTLDAVWVQRTERLLPALSAGDWAALQDDPRYQTGLSHIARLATA